MPKTALKSEVTLDDKYTQNEGQVFITGTQALVRLPLEIRKWDVSTGLNTAGFISGYRGSPLARYDQQLWQAEKHLKEHHITFTPGINEDLGATAVWGSQQTKFQGKNNYDGVFGLWYGKGPGVDRSVDVLRHANAAGTDENGGVLALMGDDHGCVSSTLGHQSEQSMEAAHIPVLHPASIQEYLDWGVKAIAMSRFSGAWVGFKCVTEIVESSATVDISPDRFDIKMPDYTPSENLHARLGDDRLKQESRLYEKLKAVKAFARENEFDKTVYKGKKDTFGILTTGKSYGDTLHALRSLGLDEKECAKLGIRLHKVGLVWPLEEVSIKKFAEGLDEILVVEEKRSLLERQTKEILFEAGITCKVTGKTDARGETQLQSYGELSPAQIAKVIVNHLPALTERKEIKNHLRYLEAKHKQYETYSAKIARLPYYCAGCPHNLSTKVPEGSRAVAGIGCHFMVLWMDRETESFTQMGGEGVTWIGEAQFTDENHIFSNLGDGTYEHSGLLAIRAAVAAKVNITYKILYNDAVAMTGGQPVEGSLTVDMIARQVAAENVTRVVVVSEKPAEYKKSLFPIGTTFEHRDDFEAVQKDLREIEGTTVVIYDQTCAAEKRRRRKKGELPDPDTRVFINDRVCEDCGDCSAKSNCVAVEPKETDYGRKRQINQSSCNKDYSCVKGFCPSFITLDGAVIKKSKAGAEAGHLFADIPQPKMPKVDGAHSTIITGIGGTGVVTIGAIMSMAAHIEGKGATVLDQTGLAQKNGAVSSHLKIANSPEEIDTVRIDEAEADLLLGCDLVVSASPAVMKLYDSARTKGVLNTALVPHAGFVMDTAVNFHEKETLHAVQYAFEKENLSTVDATRIATKLMGDAIATNMFMLGYALQKGWVPLTLESLEKTIALNGVAVKANLAALSWGRLMAHDSDKVLHLIADEKPVVDESLDGLIQRRSEDLVSYQNKAYANMYEALVANVRHIEAGAFNNQEVLTKAVAKNGYKLMAYKDEYEVARLYTDGDFLESAKREFSDWRKMKFHLSPPLLARKNKVTGEPKKYQFGPWIFTTFKVLSKMKGLRGTVWDVFGYSLERKTERKLIQTYFDMCEEVMKNVKPENYDMAIDILNFPESIKGYGPVKERNVARALKQLEKNMEAFKGHKEETKGKKLKVAIS
jgi:indolepyruvate ferredoxin oxidoreductase